MTVKQSLSQQRKAARNRKENERIRLFNGNKFPNCIGTFPDDCVGVTRHIINKECILCPYFEKKRYMIGLKELTTDEIKHNEGIMNSLRELGETIKE